MTPEQFVYWLQGFSEIHNGSPSDKEWQIIQDHLKLVFDKKTPNRLDYPVVIKENPPVFDPNKFGWPGSPLITC